MTDSRAGGRGPLLATAAVLALAFAAMPAWRGMPAARGEYRPVTEAEFGARLDAMIKQSTVGEENGLPVVRPPPGDVYLAAERWRFRPILELEAGKSYRIHVASQDILHGVVIAGREALLAPGTEAVLPLVPGGSDRIAVLCSDYCGLEHNKMRSWINVIGAP